MTLRIYLAGPAVFRPDALAHGQALKGLCREYGFEGLFPLDQAVPESMTEPAAQAAWIYQANLALIQAADLVLADLDFFRGAEPDSGTCFEVGYAVALGKPVYAHVNHGAELIERIRRHCPEQLDATGNRDVRGWSLEEFGLPLNLMLAVSTCWVEGDVRAALDRIAQDQQARATR